MKTRFGGMGWRRDVAGLRNSSQRGYRATRSPSIASSSSSGISGENVRRYSGFSSLANEAESRETPGRESSLLCNERLVITTETNSKAESFTSEPSVFHPADRRYNPTLVPLVAPVIPECCVQLPRERSVIHVRIPLLYRTHGNQPIIPPPATYTLFPLIV